MKSNYEDITKEWLKMAKPNSHEVKDMTYVIHDNIKYTVDNKNVVLDYSPEEKNAAVWIENTFGGEIYMLPRVNKPEYISTADFLWNNEKWDLKSINGSGKRALEDSIKKKSRQANNFIFDITNSKLDYNNLLSQLQKIYNSKTTSFVDKVIIKRFDYVLFIYKRK